MSKTLEEVKEGAIIVDENTGNERYEVEVISKGGDRKSLKELLRIS